MLGLIRSAAVAVGTTSVAILALSRRETAHPFAAFNAVSQMIWGEEAVAQDGFSLRHTVVGVACMAGALSGWATIATVLAGRRPSSARAVASGVAAAGLAYAIDYHVVPPRLRPGIERRLSPRAVELTFGALAAGLVAGQLLRAR